MLLIGNGKSSCLSSINDPFCLETLNCVFFDGYIVTTKKTMFFFFQWISNGLGVFPHGGYPPEKISGYHLSSQIITILRDPLKFINQGLFIWG